MRKDLEPVAHCLDTHYQEIEHSMKDWWNTDFICKTFVDYYHAYDEKFHAARASLLDNFRTVLRTKYELELVCQALVDSDFGFVRGYLERLVEPLDFTLREARRLRMQSSARIAARSEMIHHAIHLLEKAEERWMH